MRILIDGYNLSKEKGTGVANYGKNLANTLSEAGHEVGIIFPYNLKMIKGDKNITSLTSAIKLASKEVPSLKYYKLVIYLLQALFGKYQVKEALIDNGLVIPKSSQDNFFSYRIFYRDSIFQLAKAFFQLTDNLLPVKVPNDIDVVHWTYPIPIRALNKPNIYTIHDLVPMRLPYTTLDDKEFYVKNIAKICRTANKIVAVSNNTKEDLCELFNLNKDQVFVSWQSSDINKNKMYSQSMQEKILHTYQLSKQGYLIFVGNIEPKKNVRRIIQAYLGSNSEQSLVIVGNQAWKSEEELAQYHQLQKIMKLSNNRSSKVNQIRIMNYLPKQEMITLLANAKALIFPSLYEGFGLPVLEAMQLGVPVLTSNTSSISEIAGEAAFYVDPYNVEEISCGIDKLSTDSELCQHLSQEGFKRAEKFCFSSYQARMVSFYNSVASSSK